jgi:hypothetical protein
MQERYTSETRRDKLSSVAAADGRALEPLDVDQFLSRGPYYFYDPDLDAPPRKPDVERLARLGIPRSFLINAGTILEASTLLDARRSRNLASPRQARLLQRQGHERAWSIKFTDVGAELRRLKKEGTL